jgi:DNA-binding transcriptional ArsR family regulator
MRMKCLHVFLENLENEADSGDDDACKAHDLSALKGTQCEKCYDAYEAERTSIARIADRMRKYRRGLKPAAKEIYMSQLPDDIVVSGIVEPLSHEARFRILKSLSVKSMTYTEISGITGLDGGHLLYHLNKLVSAGLVDKADGKYAISDKGMGIMELIKKLYSA